MDAPSANDNTNREYDSWFYEHRFEVLLLNELVRNRIARCSNGGQKRAGVLDEIEKAFGAGRDGFLFGVSLAGGVLMQRAARMRLARKQTERLPLPVGRAIVAVLCSLASRNQELTDVAHTSDGCTLAASVTFSSLSLPALLVVGVRRKENDSIVEAEVQLPGGVIDWRKSKRILENLYRDIPHFASLDDYL